jgi:hypothetical protein
LISGKLETTGSGSVPRTRNALSTKGVTLSQALPSCSSTLSPLGTSLRTASASTRQCAKSRSFQHWPSSHRPGGSGQGRCAVSATVLAWRAGAWSSSIVIGCRVPARGGVNRGAG